MEGEGTSASVFALQLFRCFRWVRVEQTPYSEHLGDAPGLGHASFREVRWVAFEDLRNGAQPAVAQMVSNRAKDGQRGLAIAGQAINGLSVRAQEPAPSWSLMVGSVAVDLIAAVGAAVGRIVGRQ